MFELKLLKNSLTFLRPKRKEYPILIKQETSRR